MMTDIKTAEDLASELAAATQSLPDQYDLRADQHRGDVVGTDFTDPIAVHAAICQVTPFGDMLRFEGIVESCQRGQGHALLQLMTPPVFPKFEMVSIKEIVPTIEFIASYSCLQSRAEAICRTGFFGTCAVSRALIEEVADAGPLGSIAQSYLHPPVKPKRRRSARNRTSPRSRVR